MIRPAAFQSVLPGVRTPSATLLLPGAVLICGLGLVGALGACAAREVPPGTPVDADGDPLSPAEIQARYAVCPRPDWTTGPRLWGLVRAVDRASPGGRAQRRAIGAARQRLGLAVRRAAGELLPAIARAVQPHLDGAPADASPAVLNELLRALDELVLTRSRVAELYEDCVTHEAFALVALDPAALVATARAAVLAHLEGSGALAAARVDAAGAALTPVLEARFVPAEPPGTATVEPASAPPSPPSP